MLKFIHFVLLQNLKMIVFTMNIEYGNISVEIQFIIPIEMDI